MSAFRVMHVDDEPDIREVVELSLALDPELDLKSCASGRDALDAVEEWAPHLVLLDVMMPTMDGPTTLRHLRQIKIMASTPVVFMTARAQAREIESFRSLGAVGVIPKPFDPMTLAAEVRSYATPATIDLGPLAASFRERALRDATDLAALGLTLETGSAAPALEEIRRLAHSLAGAAALFGLADASDKAAALLQAVEAALNEQAPLSDVAAALATLVDELGRA